MLVREDRSFSMTTNSIPVVAIYTPWSPGESKWVAKMEWSRNIQNICTDQNQFEIFYKISRNDQESLFKYNHDQF